MPTAPLTWDTLARYRRIEILALQEGRRGLLKLARHLASGDKSRRKYCATSVRELACAGLLRKISLLSGLRVEPLSQRASRLRRDALGKCVKWD